MSECTTETRLAEIVFPNMTNHYGTLFGGHALKMMDVAAFIAASRYCRKTVVTASSDKVDFKRPVKNGHLVEVTGRVKSTGHTSITVEVDMYVEDILTGERELCTTGEFVMVALDENGKPTPVKPFKKEGD